MRMGAYEIAKCIAKRTGYAARDLTPIVCMVFEVMKEELIKGNGITVRDFGRFDLVERKPYEMYSKNMNGRFMTGYKARVKFQQSRKLGFDLSARFDPSLDWGKDDSVANNEVIDSPLKDEN